VQLLLLRLLLLLLLQAEGWQQGVAHGRAGPQQQAQRPQRQQAQRRAPHREERDWARGCTLREAGTVARVQRWCVDNVSNV
jgi:hypothetical protein